MLGLAAQAGDERLRVHPVPLTVSARAAERGASRRRRAHRRAKCRRRRREGDEAVFAGFESGFVLGEDSFAPGSEGFGLCQGLGADADEAEGTEDGAGAMAGAELLHGEAHFVSGCRALDGPQGG